MIRRVVSARSAALILAGISLGTIALPSRLTRAQEIIPNAPALQPFQPPEASPAPTPIQIRRALPVTPGSGSSYAEPPMARAPSPTPTPVSPAWMDNMSGRPSTSPAPAVPPSSTPSRSYSFPPPGGTSPVEPPDPAASPGLVQRREAVRPPAPRPAVPGAPAASEEGDSTDIRIAPRAPGVPTASPEEVQFNLANDLYVRKQYAQAAAEYERFLGLYSGGSHRQAALWWLGECYRNLDRVAAARSSYQNLVIAYTEGEFVGPANFRLGAIDYAAKDYKTSLPFFQRSASLAKADDVRLSSRYFEALCLENLGRRDETREVYQNILAVTGNNPYRDDAHLALARIAVAAKQPNEALKQYEALSREATKPALQAESALKAGLLARELQQNDTAMALFTRAAEMPAASPAIRNDALIGQLHVLYDNNKYQRLLDLYEKALPALSAASQPEAILMAANSQRQTGKHAEAQALYARIVQDYSKSPQAAEARYQRIISLYASNSPGFVSEADEFLLSSPTAVKADQVRLMKADTLFKKEDYAAAALAYGALDNSSNLPPKYKAEAAYRLGYCYAQNRQPEKTIAAFTKFLRAYPEHAFRAKALVQRAVAFQQLKNYTSAMLDFDEVIMDHREAKERPLAMQQKALILGQQERSREMADAFRALLKEYPKTDAAGMAHFYIARGAFDLKDYSTALASFESARRTSPKEYGDRATFSIILCNFQLKNKDRLAQEVDVYLKSGAQPPIHGEVLRWLGEQEYEEKKYDDAERHLALAAASPTNKAPETWLLLTRARLNLQRWESALESSRRYLEASGAEPATRAVALLAQGDALLGLKQFEEAQKSAEEVLQLQPEGTLNAKARLLGGRVSFGRGEFEQAGKSFMSVAVLYDDDAITPEALRQAAEAFEKAGKPAEAAKAAEELKSRFPNHTAQTP
jgi:TolA-binding protein